jgi:hypothetical protein
MTAPVSAAASHQAEQSALAAELWLELTSLGVAPSARFIEPAAALIQQYALASAALAADFYETERDFAGGRTGFTLPTADPPPDEQVQASLSWATEPLRRAESDRALAESRTEGASQRLVVNAGRETLTRAVTSDQYARGWARVPSGAKTCAFCMMLCTRGAVYVNRGTAGADTNSRFAGDGQFKFHDNDDCQIVPVFRGQRYEPPAVVHEWEQLYRESTAHETGEGKLRAFRRAVESSDK